MKAAHPLARLTAIALALPLLDTLTPGRLAGEARPGPTLAAEDVTASNAASPQERGVATYERLCQACHGSGAAGAPRLGSKEAWSPRIAQGIDALLQSVIDGKGAMPPRGTCGNCSDSDLAAAIAYMISRAR